MTVRWTVRTGGTPCPQTRQVLFGAPKSKKRDLSLFFDFYTYYKLELQFALRAVTIKSAQTLAQKGFRSPFLLRN